MATSSKKAVVSTVEEFANSLEQALSKESTVPDDVTVSEAKHYSELNYNIASEKLQKLRHENDILSDNREQRKLFSTRIYRLTCGWIVSIFLIIFLKGWKIFGFELDNNVVITLITSTTVNFFAFFLLILRYLYNTGKPGAIGKPKPATKPV